MTTVSNHIITTARHLAEIPDHERATLFSFLIEGADEDVDHATLAMQAWRRIPEKDRAKARKMLAIEFETDAEDDPEDLDGGPDGDLPTGT